MQERSVELLLDPADEPTTDDTVFYNTDMTTNRDISVACLAAHQSSRDTTITVCDAHAASGVRGLRYLFEVEGVDHVIFNDNNPAAITVLEENLAANEISEEQTTVLNQDTNRTLTHRFRSLDYVDIDPFGSPAPFLDSAARSLKHGSVIGVTATDLGPLYGTYPEVCRRRYASRPLKNRFGHETGLRILLKELFNTHARYDYAFKPLCVYYERHYYRIFGSVQESKKTCNRRLEYIGELSWCPDCGWRSFQALNDCIETCPHCSQAVHTAGPLWTGALADPAFTADVASELENRGYDRAHDIITTLTAEAPVRTPFYDTHELAAAAGAPAPRKQELLDALHEQGYTAVETHFTPQGVRTDAPIETLHDVLSTH